MFFHFIMVSNNYISGRRIGWHFSTPEQLDPKYLMSVMNNIEEQCGNVQFGVHKLITDDSSIMSVIEKDSFFKDVLWITDSNEFIKLLNDDRKLSVLDIAKFILSFGPMSHLKLQKMIYFAFADYLLKTNKRMFPEEIVAYKYGPVVEEVYFDYKHYGSDEIEDSNDDNEFVFYLDKLSGPSSMLKIISSEDGLEVASSVVDVMIKYADYSAIDLVNLSHKKGGPWDRIYDAGMNHEITEQLIKKYHPLLLTN